MSLDRRYVDILTMGRSGVDIFPLQVGEHLEDVKTFGKFLGGSPTNVAVAVARLGHRAGVITGVGDDPFGRFVTRELERLGVSSDHVVTVRDFHTPVTFAELFPPDSFPLYFYREPSAPDLELRDNQVDWDAVERAGIFWFTVTGLSRDSSFGLHLRVLDHRDRGCGCHHRPRRSRLPPRGRRIRGRLLAGPHDHRWRGPRPERLLRRGLRPGPGRRACRHL